MTKTLPQILSERVFTSLNSAPVLYVWSMTSRSEVPKAGGFFDFEEPKVQFPSPCPRDLTFLETGGLLCRSGWGGGTFSEPRLFCLNVGTPFPTSGSSLMCLDCIHLLGRRCKACRLLWVLLRGTSSKRLKASLGFYFQSINDLEIVGLSSSSFKYLLSAKRAHQVSLIFLSVLLTVTEMLVNILNICSDDELISDGDETLEGKKHALTTELVMVGG